METQRREKQSLQVSLGLFHLEPSDNPHLHASRWTGVDQLRRPKAWAMTTLAVLVDHAGQRLQGFLVGGNDTAMSLEQFGQPAAAFRLGGRETDLPDQGGRILDFQRSHGFGRRSRSEQCRRDLVDLLVGRLRTQQHGDEQRRITVVQGNRGLRVQLGQDRVDPTYLVRLRASRVPFQFTA